jgi:hypothetical protein
VVAILIDPTLEPDTELQGLTDAAGDPAVAFLTLRRTFYWDAPDDAAFIGRLCALCIPRTSQTQMIIQEYTGEETPYRLLPYVREYGERLKERVLYDVTYGTQGGCFLDFSAVRILRDPTGGFIQPQYLTLLHGIVMGVHTGELYRIATERINTLRHYTGWVLTAEATRPAWCSDERMLQGIAPIAQLYNVKLSTEPGALTTLLTRFVKDLSVAADVSAPPIAELLSGEQFASAMYLLRDIAFPRENSPHPR